MYDKNTMNDTAASISDNPVINVKFFHRGLKRGTDTSLVLRQFPGLKPTWGKCQFIFDVDAKNYDWVVVYHDLPNDTGIIAEEKLQCPREHTLLLTGEPSTITVFGGDYLKQFGHILTFQEPWAIRHPGAIFHHPGLLWYYGLNSAGEKSKTWDEIAAMELPEKTSEISTVCSSRTGKTTLHSARVEFTWWLKKQIPQLEIYGHGVRPMNDKSEALDSYMHHIIIENHVQNHHLTEKLPDAFLGYTLPFYHGAPNADEYFPKESFIPIDFKNKEKACEIIQFHLKNNEFKDRLPYIKEARRRVLEEENLFAIVSRTIEEKHGKNPQLTVGGCIRNRPTLRLKNPLAGIRDLSKRVAVKSYHRFIK